MELQFEVRCSIAVDYLVEYMGEEGRDSFFDNATVTVNKKGKNWNLVHTVSNETIKNLLYDMITDASELHDDTTITIKDKIDASVKNIIFTVTLKEDFYSYDPEMLHELIDGYKGIVTRTCVSNVSTAFNNDDIICNISPINPNFVKVCSLLEDNFSDVSIKLGDVTTQPPHMLNYIVISGKFREDYRKKISKKLLALSYNANQ